MEILRQRILTDGKHLGKGILKVDSFMNHQIDPILMQAVGEEFAARFKQFNPTRILTAETSGIAPALAAAMSLKVPLVFARKHKPVTMAAEPYVESAPSHTKGGVVDLIVSSEYLESTDRVLIVDDFLASAKTLVALVNLVKTSGATLVGIGAVIEKEFQGGRALLKDVTVPIESLAIIESMDETIVVKPSKAAV
ncbi:MAG: xanthine phosphoribosyltransferase [Candidatus Melainabacteria bacterium]|jgi:xanthine phosphoribosyltransferase|nr:xanthine phosphoribosyltransferase [Candidatus Melainabacteria bacterium]